MPAPPVPATAPTSPVPTRPRPPAGVGVIGLGAMGGPIAGHLLAAGPGDAPSPIVVLDPDDAAAAPLVAAGAQRARGAAELAGRVGVVIVMVATDDQLRAVLLGPTGVYAAARPGTVVLLSSSALPETCRELAAAAPSGVAVLDAAVTGGVRGAEGGELTVMAGGDPDALAAAEPALRPWTRAVHHLGPVGAGQVGKTVNNLVHWAQIVAVAQAFELGRRLGGDIPRIRAAMFDSPTDSRTLREIERMRFTWFEKDIANADRMAEGLRADLSLAHEARRFLRGFPIKAAIALMSGADPGLAEACDSGYVATD